MDIFDATRSLRPDYRHYRETNATVLPAIHSSFMQYSGRADIHLMLEKHGFDSFADFNFLSPNGLYLYDAALYSAGGAELDIEKSIKKTPGIWMRRPDTTLISDSGGFQVFKGLWTPREYYERREQILRWQEEISDIGIAMDVPSGSVRNAKAKSIRNIDDALRWSKTNFDWQIRNRNPNKMRLLNVVQGLQTEGHEGVLRWYDEIKGYCDRREWGAQAFDGWSFGGHSAQNTQAALRVIARMLDDGLLGKDENHQWIHFLGVTNVERVATFTLLQSALRKILDDAEFTVSCDSSNACFAVGQKGNYYADGPKKIVQRKVLHAAFFQLPCGMDCMTKISEENPDCPPCIQKRITDMFAIMGTATINIHLIKRESECDWVSALIDLVNMDDTGRLSRTGYLYFMNVSLEMFLRHTYRRSSQIAEQKADMVDLRANALRSETPETDLAKLKLA